MEGNDGGEQRELGNKRKLLRTSNRLRLMWLFIEELNRRNRDISTRHYQLQKRGLLRYLRSLYNKEASYVKFCNGTGRNVVLYWIDYVGRALSFGTLPPGGCVDMDTYVTHPWIFVDEETGVRFMAKQKDVYFPEPNGNSSEPCRTFVYITPPIYTLQELAARVIMGRLRNVQHISKLEIPALLKAELELKMKVAKMRTKI